VTAVNGSTADRILDAEGLTRTIRRLAHEVAERHPGLDRIVIAAIREGGIEVARALAAELESISGVSVPVVALDLRDYRDDRPRPSRPDDRAMTALSGALPSIDNASVIVVDDVIHTGRSLRAALDLLASQGRPAVVEPLALIDRGQRELPIKASFVGKNIPAAHQDWVTVLMDGGERGVYLMKRA
jgi:pyrimidine operon attenuation protein / uracil phosphoribosyltransferase